MSRKKEQTVSPKMPTGFIRLSTAMYRFACHCAFLSCGEKPSQPVTTLVLSSVLHATASLEAFANEELETSCGLVPEIRTVHTNFSRMNQDAKWRELPQLLFGRQFRRGVEPLQAFRALVAVRNVLVHYTPLTQALDAHPELEDIGRRYGFIRMGSERLDWSERLLTPECARWACQTARTMVLGWYDLAKLPVLRDDAAWRWSLEYLDGREPPPFLPPPPVEGGKRTVFTLRYREPIPEHILAKLAEVSAACTAERERHGTALVTRLGEVQQAAENASRKRAGLGSALHRVLLERLSTDDVRELEALALARNKAAAEKG